MTDIKVFKQGKKTEWSTDGLSQWGRCYPKGSPDSGLKWRAVATSIAEINTIAAESSTFADLLERVGGSEVFWDRLMFALRNKAQQKVGTAIKPREMPKSVEGLRNAIFRIAQSLEKDAFLECILAVQSAGEDKDKLASILMGLE